MPSKTSINSSSKKRHQKATSKKAVGMSEPAFRRVARAGGIRQVPASMYEAKNKVLDHFFRITLEGAITFAANDRRKTVHVRDIKNAMAMRGRNVYGDVRVSKRTAKKTKNSEK